MQRNGTDDLAGSYIEVSLDNQHLWLYKDGALVTETDIVSGAPTKGRDLPWCMADRIQGKSV